MLVARLNTENMNGTLFAPTPTTTRRQLLLLRAQQAVLLTRLAFEPLQQSAERFFVRKFVAQLEPLQLAPRVL